MPSLTARVIRHSLVRGLAELRPFDVAPDTPVADIDVAAIRARFERVALVGRLPRRGRVEVEPGGPVAAEWVVDSGADEDRVVLWLHGGAHSLCSPRTHRMLAWSISRVTRARVLVPDFRLAPEHPFPAARDDAAAAYRWLLDEVGLDAGRVAVGGDSSGGGLATSLLVHLRDVGAPLPACATLLSPWVDLTLGTDSWQPGAVDDPWLPAHLAPLAVTAYRGALPADDPGVSPLYADLSGLPPLLVHVGTDEHLTDEGQQLAHRARAAGVDASVGIWAGMWHVFQAVPGMPETRRALREIGGFVRRHTEREAATWTPAPQRTT